MSTQFLEQEFSPFDLLVKNLFDTSQYFTPAIKAKLNYPIDIYEDDLGLSFELACTGISKDAIEIKIEGDTIIFTYDKEKSPQPQSRKYVYKGISKRSFHLAYKVGAKFNLNKAKASFTDGLLSVQVPFAETAKPHTLKIN